MKLLSVPLATPEGRRSLFAAVPDSDPKKCWRASALTVLCEASDEASVTTLIDTLGLKRLIDEKSVFVVFPNCDHRQWNYSLDPGQPNDAEFVAAIQDGICMGMYTGGWRASPDVHYLLGIGSGASLINTLIATRPTVTLAAAVCTVGGVMCEAAMRDAVYAPVPAWIVNGSPDAIDYFVHANQARITDECGVYICRHNSAQRVYLTHTGTFGPALMERVWTELLSKIRRVSTSKFGDVDYRVLPEKYEFIFRMNETCLGDNGGLSHDWIEAIPSCVRNEPTKKVPLVLFSHGMSGNPLEASDNAKLHEVGEREGFITVYTYSCDRYKWNLNLDPTLPSDVDYYLALINHLKTVYPIDETRIYTSGFSNGAGMAMVFALTHPEVVAASFPVDSTFPYSAMQFFRGGGVRESFISPVDANPPRGFIPNEDPEKNMAPLRAALEAQKTRKLRLPVMYFYGTRENEYPICSGCNQELSYNFWKAFNNIPIKPTVDGMEPYAVGVEGDEVTQLHPDHSHPEHVYYQHVFYTADPEPRDYYYFMLMVGKTHEVHPIETTLGWNYVSRFRRMPDGSLSDSKHDSSAPCN